MKIKGFILLFVIFIVLLCLPLSAEAEPQQIVYDDASLFTEEEITRIEEYVAEISDSRVRYVVGTTDIYYYDREALGDAFCSNHGISQHNNVILLIIDSSRLPTIYYDVYTYGTPANNISDTEVDRILYHDDVYDNLKSGRFLEGSLAFFKYADVANFGHLAMPLLSILLISVIVGAVVATIVCICVIVKYKTKLKSASYPIDKYAKLVLRTKEDIFLGSSVSRVRVSSSSSSGGRSGGGGGGHRGGA